MATGEVAMAYTRAAMERAMKVADVLLHALKERQPWIHVAEVLGVSPRTVRRLRWRYEHHGFEGLFDHRHQRPSPRCARLAEVQRVLGLYRDRYVGFNVRHFHEIAQREHGLTLSYSFVKKALQSAGLVTRRRPRGRHRRRREPRPCFGELVHLDGSLHPWLALVPGVKHTLIAVVDDATKQLLYAELVDGGESTAAIMTVLRAVLERYGLPAALYTDRAHWAVHTPTSGTAPDRFRLTQLGRALQRLGIEHIVSYSPQARGRSERVNGTLQDRLVNELRVAGVRTVAAARPAGAGPPAPRRPALCVVGAPLPWSLRPPRPESGGVTGRPMVNSGQITCQTRAVRSLVNDRRCHPYYSPSDCARLMPITKICRHWSRSRRLRDEHRRGLPRGLD